MWCRATDRAHASRPFRYGDPANDGAWRHWDHEILPHWNEKLRGSYPTGAQGPGAEAWPPAAGRTEYIAWAALLFCAHQAAWR